MGRGGGGGVPPPPACGLRSWIAGALGFFPLAFLPPGHRVINVANRVCSSQIAAGASGADKSRSQLEATRYKKANWCANVK